VQAFGFLMGGLNLVEWIDAVNGHAELPGVDQVSEQSLMVPYCA
jgi:hypothetical protein